MKKAIFTLLIRPPADIMRCFFANCGIYRFRLCRLGKKKFKKNRLIIHQ